VISGKKGNCSGLQLPLMLVKQLLQLSALFSYPSFFPAGQVLFQTLALSPLVVRVGKNDI
jgi:hypothetical protein